MAFNFEHMATLLENHQKKCGTLVFAEYEVDGKPEKVIECTGCHARAVKGEKSAYIEMEEYTIEII